MTYLAKIAVKCLAPAARRNMTEYVIVISDVSTKLIPLAASFAKIVRQ
jgi:hypothetical protein